jgi:hypothetical protein
MKNMIMVSAVAWLLTITLALVSSPSKSAGNELCLVHKGGTLPSKTAAKLPTCEAYVGSDTRSEELDTAKELKR